MRFLLLYFVFYLYTFHLQAQEVLDKGLSYIDVYMPDQYDRSGKIWEMMSNDKDILFLASDKGLLEYDGSNWKRYKGSKGFTRSLHVFNDSLIYTGSDLDFGKWELNAFMEYEYTSLYPFKENVESITEEFWDVYKMMDFIVFVSFNNIYLYKNNQLTKISAPSRFSGSYSVGDSLYFVDEKFGVYSFDGITLKLEFGYQEQKEHISVIGVSKLQDELIFVTQKQGVFINKNGKLRTWSSELSKLLSRDQAFSFTTINDQYFVFGTILNGVYITDRNGQVVQHFNKQKGLPNNTILNLYYGQNGILWVSMDLGLAAVRLAQNVAYVFDYSGEFGTGQTALINEGVFYLGTNQGLYESPWNKLQNDTEGISFVQLPGSTGQVWKLSLVNNDILCGHDKGLFQVKNNQLNSINDKIGVLDIVQIDENHFYTGTYNGIHLYVKDKSKWQFFKELDLIKGACSQIILENDQSLWVNIPNYGVINAKLDSNKDVESREIFPLEDFIGDNLHFNSLSNDIRIETDRYEYIFERDSKEFISKPISSENNDIKHRLPNSYVPTSLNDTFQFHPIYNGFAIENQYYNYELNNEEEIVLRSLHVFNVDTSFIYDIRKSIPYIYNNLKIKCIVPHKENVNYRYFIGDYMEKWSAWSSDSEIELLNLNHGDYDVQIEARMDDQILSKLEIPLKIEPPWYRSSLAIFAYILGLVGLVFGFYRLQKFRLEKQKSQFILKEQEALRIQAERFKKETSLKEQEKLKKNIQFLEKELKDTRIQLLTKAKESEDTKRILDKLSEKLGQLEDSDSSNKMIWKDLLRIIDSQRDKDNNTFQIIMDDLNQEFSHKLKSKYPDLTLYDIRLCTFIKTRLSTREIAEILNVLPSSINVSRSRLRKKLNLDSKTDLYSFLEEI